MTAKPTQSFPDCRQTKKISESVQYRRTLLKFTGTEPGDPAKAAEVLLKVSRMENPPLRLVLGRFAKQHVKEGYEESLTELERWSDLTLRRLCPGQRLQVR